MRCGRQREERVRPGNCRGTLNRSPLANFAWQSPHSPRPTMHAPLLCSLHLSRVATVNEFPSGIVILRRPRAPPMNGSTFPPPSFPSENQITPFWLLISFTREEMVGRMEDGRAHVEEIAAPCPTSIDGPTWYQIIFPLIMFNIKNILQHKSLHFWIEAFFLNSFG